MTEILYFIEHREEKNGAWLLDYDTAHATLGEARDRRERFLELHPYLKPRDVRIRKYECKRVERKVRHV